MKFDTKLVILMETRKDGKKRWEYNPWTRDYCNITCLAAFDSPTDAKTYLQDYVDRQIKASEHFGWKCYIDRTRDGRIKSYSRSMNGENYTTLFYSRSCKFAQEEL